jgi:hypothetical protein
MSPVSWQTKKTVSFFFLLLAMLDHYLKENAIPFVRIQLPRVATRLREPQSIGNGGAHRLDQTNRILQESPREGGFPWS